MRLRMPRLSRAGTARPPLALVPERPPGPPATDPPAGAPAGPGVLEARLRSYVAEWVGTCREVQLWTAAFGPTVDWAEVPAHLAAPVAAAVDAAWDEHAGWAAAEAATPGSTGRHPLDRADTDIEELLTDVRDEAERSGDDVPWTWPCTTGGHQVRGCAGWQEIGSVQICTDCVLAAADIPPPRVWVSWGRCVDCGWPVCTVSYGCTDPDGDQVSDLDSQLGLTGSPATIGWRLLTAPRAAALGVDWPLRRPDPTPPAAAGVPW